MPKEDLGPAMAAFDEGNARIALSVFRTAASAVDSTLPLGVQSRYHAWYNTLFGMALAAAGDTLAVRRLADTVEYWGQKSLYGRDRRAHHYLRGMVFAAEGHDAEAAVELRDAIHSPTHGFTRVNYELGKTLMRLNRPADVEPVVRAALHGDIDGSNFYMTRTELHELLAQAFDRQGKRDSAAVHFRAVVRAWEHADPVFRARRDRARAWLAGNPSFPSSAARRGH
jgi:predicted Zn-dependent protease